MDVLLGTESVINNLDGHIDLDNAYCVTKNTKITNLYCGGKVEECSLISGEIVLLLTLIQLFGLNLPRDTDTSVAISTTALFEHSTFIIIMIIIKTVTIITTTTLTINFKV